MVRACDSLGLPQKATFVVACSGGADSGAALSLLREARPAARLVACYVDHGLRPESEIRRDIRAVEAQAHAARATVRVDRTAARAAPKKPGASIEAWARERRYEALARAAHAVGARHVILGHHRDDLVETMLLALLRGSGIDGIAAMRRRRPLSRGVELVRPMLWAAKTPLEALLNDAGVEFSFDTTNADLRLRRNLVRQIVHDFEMEMPGAGQSLARSAVLLRADQLVLQRLTEQLWRKSLADGDDALSLAKLRLLPRALLRRVVRHEVRRRTGSARDFHFAHCDAVAAAVLERRGGTFHAGAVRVVLSAGRVVVDEAGSTDAGAREGSSSVVVPPAKGTAKTPWGTLAFRRGGKRVAGSIALDGKRLPGGTRLIVRTPRPGDKFVPAGRHKPVPLARFLSKQGVARPNRGAVPLLCRGVDIIAVLGVRAAAPWAARPGGDVLEVSLRPDI